MYGCLRTGLFDKGYVTGILKGLYTPVYRPLPLNLQPRPIIHRDLIRHSKTSV